MTFEGSIWEQHAHEVYEHGLTCDGPRLFETLEEALADWRAEYEDHITGGYPWRPAIV